MAECAHEGVVAFEDTASRPGFGVYAVGHNVKVAIGLVSMGNIHRLVFLHGQVAENFVGYGNHLRRLGVILGSPRHGDMIYGLLYALTGSSHHGHFPGNILEAAGANQVAVLYPGNATKIGSMGFGRLQVACQRLEAGGAVSLCYHGWGFIVWDVGP